MTAIEQKREYLRAWREKQRKNNPDGHIAKRREYERVWRERDRKNNPDRYIRINEKNRLSGYGKRKGKEYRARHRDRCLVRMKVAREKSRRRLDLLKMERPCYDCGLIFPPEVTDWDHRPGVIKIFELASALNRDIGKVMDEIAKCDLVCANCHRIRTKSRRQVTP
jgi:hypothetical protein